MIGNKLLRRWPEGQLYPEQDSKSEFFSRPFRRREQRLHSKFPHRCFTRRHDGSPVRYILGLSVPRKFCISSHPHSIRPFIVLLFVVCFLSVHVAAPALYLPFGVNHEIHCWTRQRNSEDLRNLQPGGGFRSCSSAAKHPATASFILRFVGAISGIVGSRHRHCPYGPIAQTRR